MKNKRYSLELSQGILAKNLPKRTAQNIARQISKWTDRALFVVEFEKSKLGRTYWTYKNGKLVQTFNT